MGEKLSKANDIYQRILAIKIISELISKTDSAFSFVKINNKKKKFGLKTRINQCISIFGSHCFLIIIQRCNDKITYVRAKAMQILSNILKKIPNDKANFIYTDVLKNSKYKGIEKKFKK